MTDAEKTFWQCEGIKSGRQLLNILDGATIHDIDDIIQNLKSTIRQFSAGPVKESMKGELQFWKLQEKKWYKRFDAA